MAVPMRLRVSLTNQQCSFGWRRRWLHKARHRARLKVHAGTRAWDICKHGASTGVAVDGRLRLRHDPAGRCAGRRFADGAQERQGGVQLTHARLQQLLREHWWLKCCRIRTSSVSRQRFGQSVDGQVELGRPAGRFRTRERGRGRCWRRRRSLGCRRWCSRGLRRWGQNDLWPRARGFVSQVLDGLLVSLHRWGEALPRVEESPLGRERARLPWRTPH